jgi:hypothetical protein
LKKAKDKVTNKMRDSFAGKMSHNIGMISRDLYQFIDVLLNYIEYKGDGDKFKKYLDKKIKDAANEQKHTKSSVQK